MIYTLVLTFFSFLCFAFYNALSIRNYENTKIWHGTQYIFIGLIISADIIAPINKAISLLLNNNFHDFGIQALYLIGLLFIAVGSYVISLHYFLTKIKPNTVGGGR